MTRPKPGGYLWKQEIIKAMTTNAIARKSLKRIINEQPSPMTLNLLIAQAANALADNLESLQALANIAEETASAPDVGDTQGALSRS